MKPIFIVTFPNTVDDDEYSRASHNLISTLENDYYIITLRGNKEDFDFKCFNAQFDEIKFEELKKLLIAEIK